MCHFGIFGWPKFGPAYVGIPGEACVVEEKEAAAILARWKGSYKLAPIAPGPEYGVTAEKMGWTFGLLASFENVYIGDGDMCFSGGFRALKKGRVGPNQPYTLKLVLRRVADGELYIDNLGSRILEDSPAELKIGLHQGGKIVLTKAK